ncbi:MAG: trigger factor [Bacteroidota bacterium]|nr:trigger factor [Bacteroidota bacterium]
MNITKELKDELNAVLKVQISKEDYEPKVKKVLGDYQKKARIDGFRPGKVPAGMINKLYGKTAMVEEINKLLSENLMKYIKEEQLNILGDPIPSEKEQKEIDWENATEFEFAFDLGLSPEFELSLSKDDKLTSYTIKPDAKLIETYSDNYARRYGAFVNCESIVDGKEMLKGAIVELENGAIKEGGIFAAESTLYLEFVKDEEIKKQFMGLQKDAVLSFNLRKAYPNDVELASILHLKKEEVGSIDADFQLTIATISKFEKAEINQELFDKIYGEGNVTTNEQFQAKIEEEIQANLSRESEYKFRLDAKAALLGKAQFNLPVEFLKRWIFTSNEGKFTVEQIEQEFGKFENDMKWQLIQNKLIKNNNLTISEEEMIEFAKAQTRLQFEQYGLFNVPDEHIESYAAESLKREEDRRRMVERKFEDKVLDYVRETVSIESKEVSSEEFDKLFEENN